MIGAFPEERAPRFLVRDRDQIYGEQLRRAIEVLDIEEVVTAARSTRQNPYASGDAPEPRGVQGPEMGEVIEFARVGRLHHRYERAGA